MTIGYQTYEVDCSKNLTKAVLSGAKVVERVLADGLTDKEAYKLEYEKLREYVFAGKPDQLWNVTAGDIETPQELQAFTERLRRNLKNKDRWIRYFSGMTLDGLNEGQKTPPRGHSQAGFRGGGRARMSRAYACGGVHMCVSD